MAGKPLFFLSSRGILTGWRNRPARTSWSSTRSASPAPGEGKPQIPTYAGKQFGRKRPGDAGRHQVEHEPAVDLLSKKTWCYPGLHWAEHCQQVTGGDPFPPLSPGETTPGVLSAPLKEGYGESPARGHKDDEGMEASSVRKDWESWDCSTCRRLWGILSVYMNTIRKSIKQMEPESSQGQKRQQAQTETQEVFSEHWETLFLLWELLSADAGCWEGLRGFHHVEIFNSHLGMVLGNQLKVALLEEKVEPGGHWRSLQTFLWLCVRLWNRTISGNAYTIYQQRSCKNRASQ